MRARIAGADGGATARTPSMIDTFTGRDAVGRTYVLYDHERRDEVVGTVIGSVTFGSPA